MPFNLKSWFRKTAAASPTTVELNGNKLIVYHRTKSGDVAGSICTIGFIAGGGAAYGVGIYSTYDLQSSLRNANLRTYGGEVLRAEVDITGFLIFDYEVAKRVYGKDYKLVDQIKHIVGEDQILNTSLDPKSLANRKDDLKHYSDKLEQGGWTSDVANSVSHRFHLDRSAVKGIIFTGRNDGHVCVAFSQMAITPLEHAWIDGKTYKNPAWQACPARSQEELAKIRDDEKKRDQFIKQRSAFIDHIKRYAHDNRGSIDINKQQFWAIPDGIFDEILLSFLYEDESRIGRLSPELKARYKDVLDVDFLIRKMKSAPTLYWDEWKQVDQETRDKISMDMITDIWDNWVKDHPGRWSDVPKEIKPLVNSQPEVEYWLAAVKKNPENWKYVPRDLVKDMEAAKPGITPQDLAEEAIKPESTGEETHEFDIPDISMGWLQAQIDKINKRAIKLGMPQMKYEVLGEDRLAKTKKVKIIGDVPVVGDSKLLARIARVKDDAGHESIVVEPLSNEPIPKRYYSAQPTCEHCNKNRRRNESYLIRKLDTDEYKIVGSTCMRDHFKQFAGDPNQIARYAEQIRQTMVMFSEAQNQMKSKDDSDKIRRRYAKKGVPVEFFLARVLQQEKEYGFTSRKQSYQSGDIATANAAWNYCVDAKADADMEKKQPITPQDMAFIEDAIEWIHNLDTDTIPEQSREFYDAVKNNVMMGYATKKNRGTIVYLPVIYRRHLQREKADQPDPNTLIASEGEQIVFKGKLDANRPMLLKLDSPPGTPPNFTPMCIAVNDEGKKVIWFDAPAFAKSPGDEILLAGIVAGNIVYGGEGATALQSVTEIDINQYEQNKDDTERKTKELLARSKGQQPATQQPQGSAPSGASSGPLNFQDGQPITGDFTLEYRGTTKFGNAWYKMSEPGGQEVAVFSPDPSAVPILDKLSVGDTVTLQGTVSIGSYRGSKSIKLLDAKVVQQGAAQPAPPAAATPAAQSAAPATAQQPTVYQDGDKVDADFTVAFASNKQTQYGGYYHVLKDDTGSEVKAFLNQQLQTGDRVHARGRIKIKSYRGSQDPYIQRVNISPAKPQTAVQPQPQPQPQAQPQPQSGNWYQKAKQTAPPPNPAADGD